MNRVIKRIAVLVIIPISLIGCIPDCDETTEIYNSQYEVIGWECVTYNN